MNRFCSYKKFRESSEQGYVVVEEADNFTPAIAEEKKIVCCICRADRAVKISVYRSVSHIGKYYLCNCCDDNVEDAMKIHLVKGEPAHKCEF